MKEVAKKMEGKDIDTVVYDTNGFIDFFKKVNLPAKRPKKTSGDG